MLKFVSKHKSGSAGSVLSANNISAKRSQQIADQMNQRDITLSCKVHPALICIISIDVMVKPMYEIESVCCIHFKEMVEGYFNNDI